jgi:hypothetical protein
MNILSPEDWLKQNCNKNDWANLEENLNDALWANNVIIYMEKYAEYVSNELLNKQYMEFMYPNIPQ